MEALITTYRVIVKDQGHLAWVAHIVLPSETVRGASISIYGFVCRILPLLSATSHIYKLAEFANVGFEWLLSMQDEWKCRHF